MVNAQSASGASMFEPNRPCRDLSRVVVFTGPSLHPDRAKALLNATILPPIKRGDLDCLSELKPKVIVCGYSAYPRTIDFAQFRAIADEVGALLMADIAHYAYDRIPPAVAKPDPPPNWVITSEELPRKSSIDEESAIAVTLADSISVTGPTVSSSAGVVAG